MARARKKSPPLTVSRPPLLVRGSDVEFRQLIHDLIAYGHRLDACRDAFAAIIGVSGAQYEILMLASRADGLSVGEVAARLHRSGAFITIEANKLVERGIMEKASDPADGRRVLLKMNAKGQALVEEAEREAQAMSDVQEPDWKHLAATVHRLELAWSHLGPIDRKDNRRMPVAAYVWWRK